MLRISAKVDYSLRELVAIAQAGGSPVKGHQLAAAEGIPPRFLGSTLADLRRAGLVESRRGAKGGYWLARAASTITVAEVIEAVDGELVDVRALPGDAASSTTAIWQELVRQLTVLLGAVTVADLAAGVPNPWTSQGDNM